MKLVPHSLSPLLLSRLLFGRHFGHMRFKPVIPEPLPSFGSGTQECPRCPLSLPRERSPHCPPPGGTSGGSDALDHMTPHRA